ncbi:hypothetical protein W97_01309 [Coniosporium apollinis CBS 100218]|uniref:Something about silencing protein 4 domain-containing protein n=1 Tax=Coniosporium apollinis (strain CBS 100218) TaxID=1168221 RepID=R7YJN5_CONA1|nr:uncharacterized protein W97_01309 [Coniosporium apollinis CBS 100218]EON62090.1 hypothetical protein W97_01309 [Coniosporium apollinis CBS 100218]
MSTSSRSLVRSSSGRFARHGKRSAIATGDDAQETSAERPAKRIKTSYEPTHSTLHAYFTTKENHQPPLPKPSLPGQNVTAIRARGTSGSSSSAGENTRIKPPTRITVTQPHGELLQTTNGVRTLLKTREDDVSPPATPNTGKLCVNRNRSSAATTKGETPSTDKRMLRSQDGGSRIKSDLAIYFPNYDDVITGAPQEPEYLNIDTPIYVVDEPSKSPKPQTSASIPPKAPLSPERLRPSLRAPPTPSKPSASAHPTSFPKLDFSSINKHTSPVTSDTDPLSDAHYFKAHRRAERKEKQLRNIEKERAMHEKVQLERLLDGLLGHDWLRVMGVTGVTDGERKDWEPKRAYFVDEVRALVDKFRQWKEEEKRVRMEKDRAREETEDRATEEAEEDAASNGPPSSDVDAWAARQLHQEAASQQRPSSRPQRHSIQLHPPLPPEPEKPFASFYSKPYLRDAALGKHRHGRSTMAFGQPVPELAPRQFRLPEEYLAPDALRAHARKRRRLRRESGRD